MTNINFGFEAIEHRYSVLTAKTPPQVADSKRFNLSALVSEIYGAEYVDHPKMPNLMEINGGKSRDFLNGAEEVQAFARQEYLKLHKSTMCKVYFFNSVFRKLVVRKLKTAKSNWRERVNRSLESTPAKVLGFVTVLFTLFQLGQAIGIFPEKQTTQPEGKSKTQVVQPPKPKG